MNIPENNQKNNIKYWKKDIHVVSIQKQEEKARLPFRLYPVFSRVNIDYEREMARVIIRKSRV